MKKLDSNVLCAQFNKVRLEHQGFYYSPEEMVKLLKQSRISKNLFYRMSQKNFFSRKREGVKIFYSFTETPIYMSQFQSLLLRKQALPKKEKFSVEEAISFLKEKGYRIFKEEGIDEHRLRKENPEIYNQYLLTKEI